MALPIRQNATHKVVLGPFVDVGDGFTPETGITLGAADEAEAILHDNGTVVDISGYTWAAITTADGYYHLTLQSGISGTIGHLTIIVQDDSVCLPVKAEFVVLEEATYDSIYASGAAALALDSKLDTIDTNVDAILVDTAEIGAAGAGLTDLGGMSTGMKAEVEAEVTDALEADGLDHLVAAAVTGTDVADNSIIADLVSKSATSDYDDFVNTTDSLQAIRDKQTDIETDTAEIGAAGAGLTDLGGMSTGMKAEVEAEVTDALEADGLDHLVAAAVTGTDVADNSIIADLVSKSATSDYDDFVNTTDSLQAIRDKQTDIETDTAEIGAAGAGLTDLGGMSTGMKNEVNAEVDTAFTTQMADSVPADGTISTREQALYAILQMLTEFAISGTTMTVKKVDGSTTLMTFTLDDGTNPTSLTRAT